MGCIVVEHLECGFFTICIFAGCRDLVKYMGFINLFINNLDIKEKYIHL